MIDLYFLDEYVRIVVVQQYLEAQLAMHCKSFDSYRGVYTFPLILGFVKEKITYCI